MFSSVCQDGDEGLACRAAERIPLQSDPRNTVHKEAESYIKGRTTSDIASATKFKRGEEIA